MKYNCLTHVKDKLIDYRQLLLAILCEEKHFHLNRLPTRSDVPPLLIQFSLIKWPFHESNPRLLNGLIQFSVQATKSHLEKNKN